MNSKLRNNLMMDSLVITFVIGWPWLIYSYRFLFSGTFGFPSFGLDQDFYLARARSSWHGINPNSTFSPESLNLLQGQNGHLEDLYFRFFGNLGLASFELTFYSTVLLSIFLSVIAVRKLLTTFVSDRRLLDLGTLFVIGVDGLINFHFGLSHNFILNRWPIPSLHFALLFFFLYFLRKFSYSRISFVYLTAFVSLSAYLYFFTFQFVLACISVIALWELISRQYANTIKVVLSTLVGLSISFPMLRNLLFKDEFISSQDSLLHRYIYRVELTRVPNISISLLLLVAASILFIWKFSNDKKEKYFVLILVCAVFIVENQQVITGIQVQPGHVHWYITQPSFAFITFIIVSRTLENRKAMFKLLFGKTLTLFLVLSLFATLLMGFRALPAKNNSRLPADLKMVDNGYLYDPEQIISLRVLTESNAKVYWHQFALLSKGNFDETVQLVALDLYVKHGFLRRDSLDQLLNDCIVTNATCNNYAHLVGAVADLEFYDSYPFFEQNSDARFIDSVNNINAKVFSQMVSIDSQGLKRYLDQNDVGSIVLPINSDYRMVRKLVDEGWSEKRFKTIYLVKRTR